jgi:hypothetical protein
MFDRLKREQRGAVDAVPAPAVVAATIEAALAAEDA